MVDASVRTDIRTNIRKNIRTDIVRLADFELDIKACEDMPVSEKNGQMRRKSSICEK